MIKTIYVCARDALCRPRTLVAEEVADELGGAGGDDDGQEEVHVGRALDDDHHLPGRYYTNNRMMI